MDQLFCDVVATGEDAMCPNSGVVPSFAGDSSDNDVGSPEQPRQVDGLDANSSSNDDGTQPLDACGGPSNRGRAGPSKPTKPSQKRKGPRDKSSRRTKSSRSDRDETIALMADHMGNLVSRLESENPRSTTTVQSIRGEMRKKAIAMLWKLPDMDAGSEFFGLCCNALTDPVVMDWFIDLEDSPEGQLAFLKTKVCELQFNSSFLLLSKPNRTLIHVCSADLRRSLGMDDGGCNRDEMFDAFHFRVVKYLF